jgi:hypothetical protein
MKSHATSAASPLAASFLSSFSIACSAQ